MLAQLKAVVLIKEEIQMAFFRLVEYLEHQHLCNRAGITHYGLSLAFQR